jgi:hypothetical protein
MNSKKSVSPAELLCSVKPQSQFALFLDVGN